MGMATARARFYNDTRMNFHHRPIDDALPACASTCGPLVGA